MSVYYAGFIPVDGRYAVFFPDFPGCNTEGNTLEEAFIMAAEALSDFMVIMADDGDVIPTPSTKEEVLKRVAQENRELGFGDLPPGTEIHPILAPNLETQVKKVAVSFTQYKLEMIDRKAQANGMTRSGFLAAAASAFDVQKHL